MTELKIAAAVISTGLFVLLLSTIWARGWFPPCWYASSLNRLDTQRSDDSRWLGWESKYGKYERRFASHHVRHSISGGSGDNGGPNTLGRRAVAR